MDPRKGSYIHSSACINIHGGGGGGGVQNGKEQSCAAQCNAVR